MNKFLYPTSTVLGLIGMIVGLGGFGILLGKDFPFVVNNAGYLSLVGLMIFVCGAVLRGIAKPRYTKIYY